MYRFSQTQHVKAPLTQVWNFYSNPANLQKLMPPNMAFEMLNPPPEKMYAGLLLRYRVAPIGGIKLPWTSKITQITEGEYFADEQVEGPFRYWHHEHRFKEVNGGVDVSDILHYKLPLEPFSKLFHRAIVNKKLRDIFDHRNRNTEQMFASQTIGR